MDSEPVVTLKEIQPDIVMISMHDRKNKNAFSEALVRGLIQAYQLIDQNHKYKVVILTGYDTYFSSGGTQEGLLAIYSGKTTFAEVNIYSQALDCRIPVISAMQGHAIGGGFVMGMYSDFILFSRESFYTTNFMKYGFTPGMGATYILPKKLGLSLSEELLIVADTHRGADLAKRGLPFPVYPRLEVVDQAIQLAKKIAEKPRLSLITLKDHMVSTIRSKLPAIIEKEVIMHEKTFHQEEVKQRIQELFRN